ncbi:MAG: ATP-binding protein, partial [Ignavibacteria bacterium]|nr:ATP-binding protein [Ignavibacteria bacterium]
GSQTALVIERKRAEEELIHERLLLRTVIDNIPDSIFCKDLAGRKTLANLTELQYSGAKSEADILGKTDFDLYPKELADGFFADDQIVIQTGKPVLNREEYLFDEKGQKKWLLTSKLPLKDENGNIVGIVGIGRNITDRKQAEEALKESGRFLKETQIIAQLGTYTLDITSGRWVSSDILDSIFGIDDDYDKSVEGWESLIHPDWKKIMDDYFIKEVIGEKVKFNKEYKIVRHNDKSERWVHGMGELKFNEDNQPITMIGTIRDITDLKLAEKEIKKQNEELLKLNAEKDKFFSIIAHDLRSPFHGFLIMTEMLTENISEFSSEEIVSYLGELNKSTQNIYKLLQNLLDWAQLKKGSFDFTPKEVSLSTTVSASIEQINKRAIQKGITIINEVPENQNVFVDERMINSILGNLLSNAVKFTGKEGKVTIKTKTQSYGMVEITVEDSGVGITERTLNKLFKIDEKVGKKGTDGELSTGLGLLLCKEFVEKHGGKIWVESEEGKGSCFIFTVPSSNKDTIEM